MNIEQAGFTIAPKDCMNTGIPKLPCDSGNGVVNNAPSLAMVYAPVQNFEGTESLYDAETGLRIGTIFKALDLPFYGIGGKLI